MTELIAWVESHIMETIAIVVGFITANIPIIWGLIQNAAQKKQIKISHELIKNYKSEIDSFITMNKINVEHLFEKLSQEKEVVIDKLTDATKEYQENFVKYTHELQTYFEKLQAKIDLLESEKNKHVYQIRQD